MEALKIARRISTVEPCASLDLQIRHVHPRRAFRCGGMNTFTFDGSWNKIKGTLKQKYAQFTDDDLTFVEGKGDELLGRLQEKLGLSKDAVTHMLQEMKDSTSSLGHTVSEKVSAAATRVGEAVGDAKAKVTEVAGDAYDYARDGACTIQGKAENFVTEQPMTALLTALAVGFIAGFLVRR